LRVGVVPYLNAVPLTAGLEADCAVEAVVPSLLAARLAEGRYDVALIPVAEAIRGVGGGYVGRYGIASEGPVASVLLFLRRPPRDVRSVLLDPASRTSAALVRWLLAEEGATPEVRVAERPAPDPEVAREDAVLVIGDPALAAATRWKGDVIDLGEAWTRRTRLPFVFARWVARAGLPEERRAEVGARLDRAADVGLPGRGALARRWAEARGEDPARAEAYVRKFVRYRIGPREEEGLARFEAIVRGQTEDPTCST
jgi:chorismate dehydratase